MAQPAGAGAALEQTVAFGENRVVDVGWLDVQRLKELELDLCGELRKLRSANVIENDLNHGACEFVVVRAF